MTREKVKRSTLSEYFQDYINDDYHSEEDDKTERKFIFGMWNHKQYLLNYLTLF